MGITHAGMPSVATLFRVFRDLERDAFEAALAGWLSAQGVPRARARAVDGKTLRGIHGEEVPGVHLVAAFVHGAGEVRAHKGGSDHDAALTVARVLLAELDVAG